jgi:proteasome accessory factor C
MAERRATPAVDRAALMMQLVPYLVGKGEVPVAEAAADFEVSPAQMRGMVERLTMIGLPGEGGYWQLPHELFDIDWDLLEEQDVISITNSVGLERSPRLTAGEAAALLAGLQVAAALPGVGDSGVLRGLLAKLARGASATPPEVIVAPGPVDTVRETVAEALRAGVAVAFTYKAPDAAPTTRTVDPVKVHLANGQWYLQGWCHLREAMRTFHLDRVSEVELTALLITHGGEPVPALFEPGAEDLVARIRFPASIAPLLGEYLERADVVVADGVATATMRVADVHSLRRLAVRHGGAVEVLEPVAARASAAGWARAGLDQYGA